jgi:outer membrane protein assembly factor BamD
VAPAERVTTLSQARADYLAGLRALEAVDYTTATELFQKVARGPSYIVYSPLARLRIADTFFFQDKFDEASEGYRAFMETSQGDPNLHYAAFMYAKSRVKALPADFILTPPSDRRDQRKVRSALGALAEFTERFPDSPHVDEALVLLGRTTDVVTSFEMEVAHFYMTRKKPAGAANRLLALLQDVPTSNRSEKVRVALVEALAASRDTATLARECEVYGERFPGGRDRAKVRTLCQDAARKALPAP